MAFATVFLESNASYSRSSESLLYKGETIKAINASLGCPETAVSDSTIGAVAMLMAIQVSTNECQLTVSLDWALTSSQSLDTKGEDLGLHSNALQTMIKMRGGIDMLGLDGALK